MTVATVGSPTIGVGSAGALLGLLVSQAQRRPRKSLQPRFADRSTADLADSVSPSIKAGQCALILQKQLAMILGELHLLLAFKGPKASVRGIITGALTGIVDQFGDPRLAGPHLGSEAVAIRS